jgi:alcohol dehydrogenase
VIETVGSPSTFEKCQEIIAPGGVIANVGMHGVKVDLHLEKLWAANIGMDCIPLLHDDTLTQ